MYARAVRDLRLRALVLACLLSALAWFGLDTEKGPRLLPDLSLLIQKRQYQALYGPDGTMQRLLRDENGDGVAEVVIVCGPGGKPERGEIDTDGDGVVDRWEYFRSDGSLEKIVR